MGLVQPSYRAQTLEVKNERRSQGFVHKEDEDSGDSRGSWHGTWLEEWGSGWPVRSWQQGVPRPCVSRPKNGPRSICITPSSDREFVLGIALSGGGSRAALFGAAGLESLARLRAADGASVLDLVRYLSSVSGGSLPASYYALQQPPRETTILGPDGAMTDAYRTLRRIQGEGESRFRERAHLAPDQEFSLYPQPSLGGAVALRSAYRTLLGPATFEDLGGVKRGG